MSVGGMPLVTRVARAVVESGLFSRVLVSTDSRRIACCAERAGAETLIDRQRYFSGSDRVAAVARTLFVDAEVVVNVQGDQLLRDSAPLSAVLGALSADGECEIATVAAPLAEGERENPDVVKVVRGADGRSRGFSRAEQDLAPVTADQQMLHHLGIYGFRSAALQRFAELPQSRYERRQRLEQLRAVEAGMKICVAVVDSCAPSINRPADVALAETLLEVASLRGSNAPIRAV